ncbi:hypothetical protein WJX75_005667 [Coccomyxa subellipsoidea]|uniref:Ankyrin n=1 Tax=Coccomyxa subellipsoidea TaxID=248742 RepID=A0ABR2Z016_9CHLO
MADQSLPENITGDDLVELLIDGARYDDAEDVQTALDGQVDVNATDQSGRTALHMASGNGHASVATTLINAGACIRTEPAFPDTSR